MIRSLIAQLLDLYQIQLDFVSLRLRQQLEKLDFRGLCECFSRLLNRLPPTAVLFCVIDSINYFEKRDWLDDTLHIVNLLQYLVDDCAADFLLLITSPVRTRHILGMFSPDARLSIAGHDVEGRSELTERQLAEASRRPRRAVQNEVYLTMRSNASAGVAAEDGLAEISDDAWPSDA